MDARYLGGQLGLRTDHRFRVNAVGRVIGCRLHYRREVRPVLGGRLSPAHQLPVRDSDTLRAQNGRAAVLVEAVKQRRGAGTRHRQLQQLDGCGGEVFSVGYPGHCLAEVERGSEVARQQTGEPVVRLAGPQHRLDRLVAERVECGDDAERRLGRRHLLAADGFQLGDLVDQHGDPPEIRTRRFRGRSACARCDGFLSPGL